MSADAAVPRFTDADLGEMLGAERAVLIVTRRDCGHCAAYEREIVTLRAGGAFGGVVFRKLVLDAPGSLRFKQGNPWLVSLDALPFTLLFHRGEHVDRFAASRAAYLRERLERFRVHAGGKTIATP